ncbi:MAG TPA: SUMF1/EgtB/PvdO family nonheme iron enzyme, partial [Micromonosporaceae bacterium]
MTAATTLPVKGMVLVPAGSFRMGSEEEYDSRPVHLVRITKPFYLSQHEVTHGQYVRVMRAEPAQNQAPKDSPDNHPAAGCSWLDAIRFCNELSKK